MAVIYARFSTDLQNERSCEDQIDLCKTFAHREGFKVVETYHDKAKSGASLHGRDGIQKMLQDARAGRFEVIIVEALDRLSRDMEDMAGIYKQMQFLGIKIVTVHEGEANTLSVGMRSIFAQLFREDNVHKVRRGMTGLVKQGLTAGGRAYGYRPDPGNRGKPVIVEEEAEIVRYIFTAYEAGTSPRAICKRLNSQYVKPPRGKLWSPSAIIGADERGSGLLRNPIYVGRIVWNKNRMIKDPLTGRRVSRPNPRHEWLSVEAPELRIIPDELFEAAQAQLAARAVKRDSISTQRRPQRLLSGLLKCGACGSGMAVNGADKSGRPRLKCSAHTNSGACPDPKSFYITDVEALVIDSLTRELATPTQIHAYAKAYLEKQNEEALQEGRRRKEIEGRLTEIEKDNERLLDLMLKNIGDPNTLSARMKAQGEERDRLKEELRTLPQSKAILVHPAAVKRFAEKLLAYRPKLELALNMLDDMGELPRLIREIIKSITVDRDENGVLAITVENWLDPFLSDENAPKSTHRGWGDVKLVAGGRIELPTLGL
ncbi:recombinase family protein [Neorhizobium petrolearium]|uniref:recombinase family protein n=1 Tax=Neorhizobium petrolearium TaxID=515361 RepID=UPI003F7D3CF1